MGDAAHPETRSASTTPLLDVQPFEPLLHAAMFEEQIRLVVQNPLANVEESELRRFQHVGADRPERQRWTSPAAISGRA